MSSGRPPFRADSAVAVLRRVCDDVPRAIHEINPEIPEWFEQIVNCLLAKNPEERFQSATEVADLLSQHLAHLQQPTIVPRPAPLVTAAATNELAGDPPARPTRSNGIWTVVVVIALSVLALWRLGPHIPLLVRHRTNIRFETTNVDARIILLPEGNSTAISAGPGDLELAPGIYTLDIAPGNPQRELETASMTIQFPGGMQRRPGMAVPLRKLHLGSGDLVTVSASFRHRLEASAVKNRWGEVIDPLSDCKFTEVDDTTLSIQVPGSYHELIPSADPADLAGPRILQNWRGPFGMSVVVDAFEPVVGGTAAKGERSEAGAGLVLWENPRHFLRFFRSSLARDDLHGACVNVQWYRDGARVGEHSTQIADTSTRLRIERRGSKLTLLFSERGGGWRSFEEIEDFGLSESIQLGVGAVNTTTTPRDFRLEWFQVREDLADLPLPPEDPSPRRASAPFSAASAARFQESWGEHLNVPVEFQNSIGMAFRLIPPGDFDMGSEPEEATRARRAAKLAGFDNAWIDFTENSAQPQHRVRLTEPYYLGVHEVTVEQFRRFADESGYVTTQERLAAEDTTKDIATWRRYRNEQPVFFLSWNDAREFCLWLSAREQRNYRLPTEAQWEFACRAGTTTTWSIGNDPSRLAESAWYGRDRKTGPDDTGKRLPNPFGLHDMHGNVPEWCVDWHMVDFYQRAPKNDPVELDQGIAQGRVIRGGAYSDLPELIRSAARSYQAPARGDFTTGFRVAIVGDLKPPANPDGRAP
jgi:formylglycine-generating enzyme required for sulfatase activity